MQCLLFIVMLSVIMLGVVALDVVAPLLMFVDGECQFTHAYM
jgi:hypothetical protein